MTQQAQPSSWCLSQREKIVLFGKTGDGKSRAGNTILREKVFIPKASANSVTDQCERRQMKVHGRKITVIDTPGFFDTDHNDEETKSEIVKSLIECAPAVDAFIIVLKVGRHTRHENEVVQKLLNTLNEDALKRAVILFTFGDQLEGKTIKEFVKASSQLQELVDKCRGRGHFIDNKYREKKRIWGNKSNKVQVKNLLKTIDKMVKENGCYSNELLQMLEKEIQEERKLFMKKFLSSNRSGDRCSKGGEAMQRCFREEEEKTRGARKNLFIYESRFCLLTILMDSQVSKSMF
uniref:Zgc:195075 n=1 Tax=Sinocyclocheilus anshuiensis TaxID=1608454 RepID=A0A671L9R2_9TELE